MTVLVEFSLTTLTKSCVALKLEEEGLICLIEKNISPQTLSAVFTPFVSLQKQQSLNHSVLAVAL